MASEPQEDSNMVKYFMKARALPLCPTEGAHGRIFLLDGAS